LLKRPTIEKIIIQVDNVPNENLQYLEVIFPATFNVAYKIKGRRNDQIPKRD
jgi:hypothetical protein